MANSRSTIYPIQLQGAELNLNKYDAEIKQYSGFNKNNSPFVGGCLSNIFEKDTTIEGANGKNVYIDDNGDVYQVDDYGFLKNGQPIGIRSDTALDFWDIEEIQVPKDNIVCYYSDEAYITSYEDVSGYTHFIIYLNGKTKEITAGSSSNPLLWKTAIIEKFHDDTVGDFFCASIKYYTGSSTAGRQYVFSCTVYSQYGDHEIQNAALSISSDKTTNTVTYTDPCLDYKNGYLFFAVNEHMDYGNFPGYIDVAPLIKYINILSFTDSASGKKFTAVISGGVNQFVNYDIGTYVQRYLACYFFKKDKCYLYANMANTGNTDINYACCLNYTFSSSGVEVVSNEDLGSIPMYANTRMKKPNFSEYIFKKYGVTYCLYNKTSDKYAVEGLCDFSSTGLSVDENDNIIFSTGGVINNSVLVNNGYVSGIALPGANVLATEWNSIDKDFIFFSNNFIT